MAPLPGRPTPTPAGQEVKTRHGGLEFGRSNTPQIKHRFLIRPGSARVHTLPPEEARLRPGCS